MSRAMGGGIYTRINFSATAQGDAQQEANCLVLKVICQKDP